MKVVKIVLSENAAKTYDKLKQDKAKSSQMLVSAIDQKIEFIRGNIHYGDPIAKRLIPKIYKQQLGITNLFRVELPQFWRMLYTLTDRNEIEIIAFIVEILDHPTYDKRFGY